MISTSCPDGFHGSPHPAQRNVSTGTLSAREALRAFQMASEKAVPAAASRSLGFMGRLATNFQQPRGCSSLSL